MPLVLDFEFSAMLLALHLSVPGNIAMPVEFSVGQFAVVLIAGLFLRFFSIALDISEWLDPVETDVTFMSYNSVSLLYPVSTALLYRVNEAGISFTVDSFLHGSGFGAKASFPSVSAAPGALGCSSYLTCHPLVLLSHDCPSISVGVLGFGNGYGFQHLALDYPAI